MSIDEADSFVSKNRSRAGLTKTELERVEAEETQRERDREVTLEARLVAKTKAGR